MKKNLPGIIFVIAISVISILLNRFFLGFIETLTIGILLGILTANIFKIPKIFNGGIDYSLKNILKWGIVLLGVKLNFNLVAELGWKILIYIILLITSVILFSVFLGKKFGINKKLSALVGIGSSICGASAIVAMGPVIEAEDEDVAISVTVISLLGAI
ncbi:MAG TPA: putative sulfate exporter family transporter, partial [Tepiditoga sp.]|nr:putative sulfate exporter family transporter [Tepiditoga sp.]